MASAHNSSDPAPTCQRMASVQNSSDPAPKCQTMALEHGSLSPGRNCQENVSHGDKTVDDNVDVEDFFQENEMPICSNTADVNKNDEAISLITQGEIKKVSDLDVGDAYIVSENDEEFVDTYDDSDDDTELNLPDHSSDEDEVDLSNHSSDEDEVDLSDHSSDEDEESWIEITITEVGKGAEVEIGVSPKLVMYPYLDANDDDDSRSGGRGVGRSGNISIGGSSNVSILGNQDANFDDGSRSGGRGRGRSGNIGIGGSSNVSGLGNQDANDDDGSRSGEEEGPILMMVVEAREGEGVEVEIWALVVVVMYPYLVIRMPILKMVVEAREREGVEVAIWALVVVVMYPYLLIRMEIMMMVVEAREEEGPEMEILTLVVVVMYPDSKRGKGKGKSGNISIGDSSNVSGLGNNNADYHDGSRSEGRGGGKSRNIGIDGSSNVSRLGNHERDRSGNIGEGEGEGEWGRSGNIGGRGSCSTSGCGNPNADYDANDNEAETSQHVRGSNLPQSIPSHPPQRPMITLYYGSFVEGNITRDIINIFKVSFYGSWTSWREVDQESRD
nr:hypothetical protein [Tanacetum cinerariifolium]